METTWQSDHMVLSLIHKLVIKVTIFAILPQIVSEQAQYWRRLPHHNKQNIRICRKTLSLVYYPTLHSTRYTFQDTHAVFTSKY